MIKEYTDIKQSKILAEILPIESADMSYSIIHNVGQEPYHCNVPMFVSAMNGDIPCWSLSALLSVLPKLGAEEPSIQKLYYASNPTERYICQYSFTNMTGEYDNPVDACCEMVLLLKEKNLIWKQQN